MREEKGSTTLLVVVAGTDWCAGVVRNTFRWEVWPLTPSGHGGAAELGAFERASIGAAGTRACGTLQGWPCSVVCVQVAEGMSGRVADGYHSKHCRHPRYLGPQSAFGLLRNGHYSLS